MMPESRTHGWFNNELVIAGGGLPSSAVWRLGAHRSWIRNVSVCSLSDSTRALQEFQVSHFSVRTNASLAIRLPFRRAVLRVSKSIKHHIWAKLGHFHLAGEWVKMQVTVVAHGNSHSRRVSMSRIIIFSSFFLHNSVVF